ncbi:MAG: Antitoxin 1, partial [uncultured Solirubrobacteraceae bacterium]
EDALSAQRPGRRQRGSGGARCARRTDGLVVRAAGVEPCCKARGQSCVARRSARPRRVGEGRHRRSRGWTPRSV